MTSGSRQATGTHGPSRNASLKKLSLVLGIRPDVIRASLLIKSLKAELGNSFDFVWSGQHYSDNMKDIFFRQLDVPAPDVTLNVSTRTDQGLIGTLNASLGDYLDDTEPEAVVFLGDTNTVTASVVVAAKNIPIVHIEGCMRSYDWRMPEEKFRTTIDHLSDRIYAYLDEYKDQGVLEGLDPENIMVTGNPIVDVLDHYFNSGAARLRPSEAVELLNSFQVSSNGYFVMTSHRRENVDDKTSLNRILTLASTAEQPVIFPAGYRTQARIREFGLVVPSNVSILDPIGYSELLELLVNSRAVLTDSGTIVEETSILGVPSVQMRTSTERPQVYDSGASVKFDPHLEISQAEMFLTIESAVSRKDMGFEHGLGDGKASRRIHEDLVLKLENSQWSGHLPKDGFRPISRNYGFGIGNLGRPK